MDTLTQAIENNTTALLSEATKDLNNKIVMSELVNMITADVDGVSYDFNKLNEANSEDA
jgi:hypothetical protein